MTAPQGFSWIDRPRLAALARPRSAGDLEWLRAQGVELLVSLTEDRPRPSWSEEAGVLVYHEAMEDMEAPELDALERAVSAINRGLAGGMGVAVHCGAGLGRTGVVLAAWMVSQGMSADAAIARVRKLRPHSIETAEQEDAVAEFARRARSGSGGTSPSGGSKGPPPGPTSPS